MGFLMRWGMIVLGALLIYGGIDEWLHRKTLSTTPQAMTVDQAVRHLESGERAYVRLTGELAETAVFPTGLANPRYTAYASEEITPLFEEGASAPDLKPLYGAYVEAKCPLNPILGLTIQTVVRQQGEAKGTVTRETVFAPLLSGRFKVWALSPAFSPSSSANKTWRARKSYFGRLIRLQDLNVNRPALRKTHQEISQYLQSQMKIPLNPRTTWVILTGADKARVLRRASKEKYYVPVKGSGGALYAQVTAEEEARFLEEGVSGILSVRRKRGFEEFNRILETKNDPARIGVITARTGAEVNEERDSLAFGAIQVGVPLFGLGILWVVLRWKTRLDRFRRHGGDIPLG